MLVACYDVGDVEHDDDDVDGDKNVDNDADSAALSSQSHVCLVLCCALHLYVNMCA